jgi:hypothetical protein
MLFTGVQWSSISTIHTNVPFTVPLQLQFSWWSQLQWNRFYDFGGLGPRGNKWAVTLSLVDSNGEQVRHLSSQEFDGGRECRFYQETEFVLPSYTVPQDQSSIQCQYKVEMRNLDSFLTLFGFGTQKLFVSPNVTVQKSIKPIGKDWISDERFKKNGDLENGQQVSLFYVVWDGIRKLRYERQWTNGSFSSGTPNS